MSVILIRFLILYILINWICLTVLIVCNKIHTRNKFILIILSPLLILSKSGRKQIIKLLQEKDK